MEDKEKDEITSQVQENMNMKITKQHSKREYPPKKPFEMDYHSTISVVCHRSGSRIHVALDEKGNPLFSFDLNNREIYVPHKHWDPSIDELKKKKGTFTPKRDQSKLLEEIWNEAITSEEPSYWKWGYWDKEKKVYRKNLYVEFVGYYSLRKISPFLNGKESQLERRKHFNKIWLWSMKDPSSKLNNHFEKESKLFKDKRNFFSSTGAPKLERITKEKFEIKWEENKERLREEYHAQKENRKKAEEEREKKIEKRIEEQQKEEK